MPDKLELREPYILAGCCSPLPAQIIVGYHSYDGPIKVHLADCDTIGNLDRERLVNLDWENILPAPQYQPDPDYNGLDQLDFNILNHHREYGIDYAQVVARTLNISKDEAFCRHKKLRDLNLIERVDATIVRYRKGFTTNKWIKHRNHTYYQLTKKGELYLDYFDSERQL